MSGPMRIHDRTRVFTTLGLRFWDAAFDVPIHAALDVHVWLPGSAFPPRRAVRSPGGVYSFHGLPGRAEAEYPGQHERPEDLGPELEYVVLVDDPAGRFLPVAFSVTLPLRYRGEFLSDSAGSEPGEAGRAYLFPASSRPVPPGAVAIRADLEDGNTGEPAAWAVIRATVEDREVSGLADDRGRVLLLAATPAVDRLGLGSPPGSGQGPVGATTWTVGLRVDYQPDALRYPLADSGLPAPWAERPSLKSILAEQGPAQVTLVDGEDPVAGWTAELGFGEPLVLRTHDADGAPQPSVRIHAGASTP